jgi:transcriptional regulator with XRE-family HTH domain
VIDPADAVDPDEPVGAVLARMRKSRRWTGAELATRVGMSQPKISRIERGRGVLDPEDVGALARVLGATEVEIRALMERVESSQDGAAYWRSMPAGLAGRQNSMADWEAATTVVRDFQPAVLPGLLQTSGYALAAVRQVQRVASLAAEDLSEAAILTAVSARIRRQEILAEPSKTFRFVLTETLLRNAICSPAEMLAQIGHLREISAHRPNLSIGVIPDDVPVEIAPVHGFSLLDEKLVVMDIFNTGLISRSRNDLESYRRVFDIFDQQASDVEPMLDKYHVYYLDKLRT